MPRKSPHCQTGASVVFRYCLKFDSNSSRFLISISRVKTCFCQALVSDHCPIIATGINHAALTPSRLQLAPFCSGYRARRRCSTVKEAPQSNSSSFKDTALPPTDSETALSAAGSRLIARKVKGRSTISASSTLAAGQI